MIGKFGIREICDVVFKALADGQVIGNKKFSKGQPVLYFDTLKTSSLEQAATTVYAQGGRGNARLIAWEGEKTLTFTMEDALISPMGMAILSGAGLIESSANNKAIVHRTEETSIVAGAQVSDPGTIVIDPGNMVPVLPSANAECDIYVIMKDAYGELSGTTYRFDKNNTVFGESDPGEATGNDGSVTVPTTGDNAGKLVITMPSSAPTSGNVLVDFYAEAESGISTIEITPDNFGGFFQVEGSCLFRQEKNGMDFPAEIIIPKVKVQSNFTFSMASSGDPSTFTFTCDAFPAYIPWGNMSKKVLAHVQIIDETVAETVAANQSWVDADAN